MWQQAHLKVARRFAQRKLRANQNNSAELLRRCWQHLPNKKTNRYLAVDLETSSLSTADGEILSAGWVALDDGEISMSSAEHHLISAQNTVGQSAAIHHLRDCDLEAGKEAQHMLEELLKAADNRVLLFHNANLDMAFLNQLCKKICNTDLLLPFADTLIIEKQKFDSRNLSISPGDLTLGQCRVRYNLPYYAGHNALYDALATAELFRAQLVHATSKR